jgi:hypothetical protein
MMPKLDEERSLGKTFLNGSEKESTGMKIVESLVLLSNMDYVVCFRHSRSLEGH